MQNIFETLFTRFCEYLFTDQYSKERNIIGGVLGAVLLFKLARSVQQANKKKQQKQFLDNLAPNTVHFFSMSRWKLGPTFSIPCLTAELYLRLAKVPYEIHILSEFSLSPTGNVPFIVYNKDVVADSAFLMDYLTEKKLGMNLDEALTAEQRALGNAVARMMTNTFRFAALRLLFVDHHNTVAPAFAELMKIPLFLAKFGVNKIRKSTIEMLNKVGHGDWTDAEYRREFRRDAESIVALLGTKPYLFGDSVSTYDCVAVARLSAIFNLKDFDDADIKFVCENEVLSQYVKRVTERAYPDMADLTSPEGIARRSQKFE